jgi:hypothetical protein
MRKPIKNASEGRDNRQTRLKAVNVNRKPRSSRQQLSAEVECAYAKRTRRIFEAARPGGQNGLEQPGVRTFPSAGTGRNISTIWNTFNLAEKQAQCTTKDISCLAWRKPDRVQSTEMKAAGLEAKHHRFTIF